MTTGRINQVAMLASHVLPSNTLFTESESLAHTTPSPIPAPGTQVSVHRMPDD